MSDLTYKGQVVDSQKAGVSGATVTVSNAKTSAIVGSTTTSTDGTFTIAVPNESVNFSASKDGTTLSFSYVTNESPDGPDSYSYTW